MQKLREINYDCLRAVSCIFVVVQHVAALYTEDLNTIVQYPNFYFSFADFLQMITRTAVPCFVMLSGAFNIASEGHLNYGSFYRKSFSKMGIHTLVFSLIFIFYRLIRGTVPSIILIDALNGKPNGHMWYMFMLIGLYAVTPLLVHLRNDLGERRFFNLSVFLVVLGSVIHFTSQLIWVVEFMEYLGYYTMGYCVRKCKNRIPENAGKICLYLSVAFLLITYGLNEYSFYGNFYNASFFRNPNFPTIIIASIMMFVAFTGMRFCKEHPVISRISSDSFIIYLCHPLIYGSINYIVKSILGIQPNPIWYVPIVCVVCLFLSMLATRVYLRIYNIVGKQIWKNAHTLNQ